MGNIYRVIDCSSDAAFFESIRLALVDKFGDDVTIHNASNWIIFSCPHLSDKVIKLYWGGGYYGSSYSSGVNINDSVCFFEPGAAFVEAHMVLGDNFLFITGTSGSYRLNVIVAKTVGGKYIVSGGTSRTNLYTTNITKDITSNKKFEFVEFNTTVMCDNNTPYKSTLLMSYIEGDGNTLMLKDDGTPDTIKDLSMAVYYNPTNLAHIALSNALLSSREVYSNVSNKFALRSSIMAEF